MRRALVVLVVLAAVLLAADVGARAVAQNVVAGDLRTSLELSKKPKVTIGGFPFLPQLVRGRVSSASASAEDVTTNGVTFHRVVVTLHDLAFTPSQLVTGHEHEIHVGAGDGTAEMTSADLTTLLSKTDAQLTVALDGDRALVESDRLGGSVEVTPSMSGRTLTLRSANGSAPVSLRVELPEVLPSVRYSSVTIRDATAVFSFRLASTTLKLS